MNYIQPKNISKKISQWLEICDFSYKIMCGFSKRKMLKKIKQVRKEHLIDDYKILKHLSILKK